MPRDYKHQLNRKKKHDKSNAPWWMLGGMLLGGLMTAAGFLFLPAILGEIKLAEPGAVMSESVTGNPESKPARETPKPAGRKPRFDFYTILPEMEVVVPERELAGKPRKGVKQVEKPGTYLLQTGSFRLQSQADRLKAKLTLLGLDVDVQQVRINNDQTWYRVRVGPYQALKVLNRDRMRLRENGIDAILLRVKK